MKNPVEEFLEMKKEAGGFLSGLWGAFKSGVGGQAMKPGGMGQSIANTMGRAFTPAVVGAGVTAAGMGMSKGIGMVRERFAKAHDFKTMLEANPSLHKEDASNVQALYNSLRRMSPTMAKDPLIAGSFIRESILKSPEEGIAMSPLTAKMLAETERNVAQSGPGHRLLDLLGRSPGLLGRDWAPPKAIENE